MSNGPVTFQLTFTVGFEGTTTKLTPGATVVEGQFSALTENDANPGPEGDVGGVVFAVVVVVFAEVFWVVLAVVGGVVATGGEVESSVGARVSRTVAAGVVSPTVVAATVVSGRVVPPSVVATMVVAGSVVPPSVVATPVLSVAFETRLLEHAASSSPIEPNSSTARIVLMSLTSYVESECATSGYTRRYHPRHHRGNTVSLVAVGYE